MLQTGCLRFYPIELEPGATVLIVAVNLSQRNGLSKFQRRKADSPMNDFRNGKGTRGNLIHSLISLFHSNLQFPRFTSLAHTTTASGSKLITSGWLGRSRHPNYLGDLLMAPLPTRFDTPDSSRYLESIQAQAPPESLSLEYYSKFPEVVLHGIRKSEEKHWKTYECCKLTFHSAIVVQRHPALDMSLLPKWQNAGLLSVHHGWSDLKRQIAKEDELPVKANFGIRTVYYIPTYLSNPSENSSCRNTATETWIHAWRPFIICRFAKHCFYNGTSYRRFSSPSFSTTYICSLILRNLQSYKINTFWHFSLCSALLPVLFLSTRRLQVLYEGPVGFRLFCYLILECNMRVIYISFRFLSSHSIASALTLSSTYPCNMSITTSLGISIVQAIGVYFSSLLR